MCSRMFSYHTNWNFLSRGCFILLTWNWAFIKEYKYIFWFILQHILNNEKCNSSTDVSNWRRFDDLDVELITYLDVDGKSLLAGETYWKATLPYIFIFSYMKLIKENWGEREREMEKRWRTLYVSQRSTPSLYRTSLYLTSRGTITQGGEGGGRHILNARNMNTCIKYIFYFNFITTCSKLKLEVNASVSF